MVRVSVVIGFYGDVKDLDFTLKSVAKQNYTDFEVVVVDDGNSVPLTKDLLSKDAASLNIRIIRNSKNLGLTKSLIVGCSEAQGEYIARIDAGDLMVPATRLKEQVELLDASPEVGIIGGAIEVADLLNKDMYRSKLSEQRVVEVSKGGDSTLFYHVTVMMRKSAYNAAGGYSSHLKVGQDTDLWLRMIGQCKGLNVSSVYAVAPMKAQSLSVSKNDLQIRGKINRLFDKRRHVAWYRRPLYFLWILIEYAKLLIPIKCRVKLRYRKNMDFIRSYKCCSEFNLSFLYSIYFKNE